VESRANKSRSAGVSRSEWCVRIRFSRAALGSPSPGRFLSKDRDELAYQLRLNALSHLDIAHHFGRKLAARGRGGSTFVSAMGAEKGIPYMANDAGAKADVQSLAQALHVELRPVGVHVKVVSPGPTETPALAILGLTPEAMPMKPMKVEQCVLEALRGLAANRSLVLPGRMNRILNAIVPASATRTMMARMFEKSSPSNQLPGSPKRTRGENELSHAYPIPVRTDHIKHRSGSACRLTTATAPSPW
jgi:short-subunit dehydrogenase